MSGVKRTMTAIKDRVQCRRGICRVFARSSGSNRFQHECCFGSRGVNNNRRPQFPQTKNLSDHLSLFGIEGLIEGGRGEGGEERGRRNLGAGSIYVFCIDVEYESVVLGCVARSPTQSIKRHPYMNLAAS